MENQQTYDAIPTKNTLTWNYWNIYNTIITRRKHCVLKKHNRKDVRVWNNPTFLSYVRGYLLLIGLSCWSVFRGPFQLFLCVAQYEIFNWLLLISPAILKKTTKKDSVLHIKRREWIIMWLKLTEQLIYPSSYQTIY